MEKTGVVFLLLLLIIVLSACDNNAVQPSSLEADDSISAPIASPNQEETVAESSITDVNDFDDIELVRDILHSYLDDCWGIRKHSHELVFDAKIELDGIEFYAFKVRSVGGDFRLTFAISVDEKLVYGYSEQSDEWWEDRNPDPWSGW